MKASFVGLFMVLATAPALAEDLTIGDWQFGSTKDGRAIAKTPAIEDPDAMELGEFSSVALVCARGGGVKLSFEAYDGIAYPAVVPFPSARAGMTLPMTANEVAVGVPLYTFLGQLIVMERNAAKRGEPFTFTFASEPDAYESMFAMAGVEYLMGFFMKECPPP